MRPFAIGSLVRPKPNAQDREIMEVNSAFSSIGKPPIGVVRNYNIGNYRIFVDWGIEQYPFHYEGIDFRLPAQTGYWVNTEFLEFALEPYDPNGEPEDDCL